MSTKLYSGLRSAITDPFAIAAYIRECLETVAAQAKQTQFGEDLARVWDIALQGFPAGSPIPNAVTVASDLLFLDGGR